MISNHSRWSGIRAMPQGPGLPQSNNRPGSGERSNSVASCMVWDTGNTGSDVRKQHTGLFIETDKQGSSTFKSYRSTGHDDLDKIDAKNLTISFSNDSGDVTNNKVNDTSNVAHRKLEKSENYNCNHFPDGNVKQNLAITRNIYTDESKGAKSNVKFTTRCPSRNRSQIFNGADSLRDSTWLKSLHQPEKLHVRPRSAYGRLYSLPPKAQMPRVSEVDTESTTRRRGTGSVKDRRTPCRSTWGIGDEDHVSRSFMTKPEYKINENNASSRRHVTIDKDTEGRAIGLTIHRDVSPKHSFYTPEDFAGNRYLVAGRCFTNKPDVDDWKYIPYKYSNRHLDLYESSDLNGVEISKHNFTDGRPTSVHQHQRTRFEHDKDTRSMAHILAVAPKSAPPCSCAIDRDKSTQNHVRLFSPDSYRGKAYHCQCCNGNDVDYNDTLHDKNRTWCNCHSSENVLKVCQPRKIPDQKIEDQNKYNKHEYLQMACENEDRCLMGQSIDYIYQTTHNNVKKDCDRCPNTSLAERYDLEINNKQSSKKTGYSRENHKENRCKREILAMNAQCRPTSNQGLKKSFDNLYETAKTSEVENHLIRNSRPTSAVSQKRSNLLATSLIYPIGCSIACAQRERTSHDTYDSKEAARRPVTPHRVNIVFEP